jgi:membrane-associated protease RseP (regulator of RpoE activity)
MIRIHPRWTRGIAPAARPAGVLSIAGCLWIAGFLLLTLLPAAAQTAAGQAPAPAEARAETADVKVRVKVEDPRRMVTVHRIDTEDQRPLVFHALGGGYLGVELVPLTAELRSHFGAPGDRGVMISRVAEGSPAERAGLAVGDIVTDVDGEGIEGTWDLSRAIRGHEGGELADLVVWRDGTSLDFQVELAETERPQVHLERMLQLAPGADGLLGVEEALEGPAGSPRVFRWKSEGEPTEMVFDIEGLHELGESMGKVDWPRLEGRLMTERNRELEERLEQLEKQLEALERALRESEERRR